MKSNRHRTEVRTRQRRKSMNKEEPAEGQHGRRSLEEEAKVDTPRKPVAYSPKQDLQRREGEKGIRSLSKKEG